MDKKLLPYFEDINDGGSQSDYLARFGSKEVQSGICLNLVIAWFYFYSKTPEKAPNKIWNEMKQDTTIKQIANNHEMYRKQHRAKNEDYDTTGCISLYGLEGGDIVKAKTVDDIKFYLQACLRHSNKQLLVIELSKGGKVVGAHAIGLIIHEGKAYMYDPNEGVLTVPEQSYSELIGLIHYIYEERSGLTVSGREIIGIK